MPLQPQIYANKYMIAAGHYLAAEAGFEILEAGGNAVDAGVAAVLALGVVQSDMVNVAGVAPMMIYLADRNEVVTITGLGCWPRAADIETFIQRHGGEIPLGLLRTVVPATPDAAIQALKRFGTMSFAEVAAAAIRYARDGFPMHELMAAYIADHEETYRMWPENAAIYLPDGRPPRVGELFVQRDLAASLQYMVDEEATAAAKGRLAGLEAARDAFYRGDIGAAIVAYHAEHGGWLAAEDLAAFRCEVVPPVRLTWTGGAAPLEVYTCGPWCQGPVMLQMLRLLDGFDLGAMGHNSAAYIHTVAEAIKLSFADRERYYGDPHFVEVPLETLLSEDYAAERRRLIRPDRAWPELPPAGEIGNVAGGETAGRREIAGSPPAPADTSYVGVVDRAGNAFSCNPSDVTYESPIVPGTGLCPSARGSQSWAVRGHASSVAPGKRPRLTPNPVMAIREGRLLMPFGTPGGDTQPQANLQVLLNMEIFGMDPQEAVEAPRFMTHSQPNSFSPHEAYPGRLTLEGRIGEATGDALATLGHDVEWLPDMTWKCAGVCVVRKDQKTGIMAGGADPRRPSRAIGW